MPGQKFSRDEFRRLAQAIRRWRRRPDARRNRRVRRGRACRARRARGCRRTRTRRVARLPPTSGLSAARTLAKLPGRSPSRTLLRIVDRRDHAAAPQQRAFGRRLDDDVGDQAGEVDVVRSDREQHEIELAIRPLRRASAMRSVSSASWARAVAGQFMPVPGLGTFARALIAEQADVDGRARAGERKEGDREVRISRPRAPARCASGSRRASGDTARSSSARSAAPNRRRPGLHPPSRRRTCCR